MVAERGSAIPALSAVTTSWRRAPRGLHDDAVDSIHGIKGERLSAAAAAYPGHQRRQAQFSQRRRRQPALLLLRQRRRRHPALLRIRQRRRRHFPTPPELQRRRRS